MAVEVLLMADVKDLGVTGKVVNVSEGHARNYLFPRKLAAPVTPATLKRIEKIKREREAASEAALKSARELAAKVAGCSCTIPVKTGEADKMFGSVTASAVVDALRAQGIELDRHQIVFENPIKELGVYDLKVKVHPEVEATLKVWVVEE